MTELPKSAEVAHRIHDDLLRLIAGEGDVGETAAQTGGLPEPISDALKRVTGKPDSYRDALLVLLAYPAIIGERLDLTTRPKGARAAGDTVGRLLPELHIKGVVGAFMNIGKNSPELVRGNNQDFDLILKWASGDASGDELAIAYAVVLARVASTARRVEPRPELRLARLTFPNVMALFDEMLAIPSGGAHEQYLTAALLEAALAQEGTGVRRVETKGLSASDRSARTAGDIEVFERGRLQEGIEVTASRWQEKIEQAKRAIGDYGIPRSHIVGVIEGDKPYEALRELAGEADISVIDVRAAVGLLTALLDRGGREFALLRVYDLLDRHLPDPAPVNAYVGLLRERELAK
jgi:hypothetical protein